MGKIRPASRREAKPLIGIYSESGRGKTYSSLMLARGFVGSGGRICMIETESGRGESYADPAEYPEIGGYDVLPLRGNFSPEEYGKAIDEVQAAGYDALIVDSASHEWESVGGVLDMAAQNQAAGKKGPIVWQKPKIDHQKHFMLKFMQTSVPLVILNMRAKYPMEEVVKNGEKKWVRSENLEPKQSEDILFEMFVHGWIDKQHNFHPTKVTSKSLHDVFADGKPISIETGRKLKQWAANASSVTIDPEEERLKNIAAEISEKITSSETTDDAKIIWMDRSADLDKIKAANPKWYKALESRYEARLNPVKCSTCGDTGYIDEVDAHGEKYKDICPEPSCEAKNGGS